MEDKELVHKGNYGKPLCGRAEKGNYMTHHFQVKITCERCQKLMES